MQAAAATRCEGRGGGGSVLPVARVRTFVVSAFLPRPKSDPSALSKLISNPAAARCLLGSSPRIICHSGDSHISLLSARGAALRLTQHSSLVMF